MVMPRWSVDLTILLLIQPFLNQRKEENDIRKYFMINFHERMGPSWDRTGSAIATDCRTRSRLWDNFEVIFSIISKF